jgi:hypothetical protein
VAVDSMFPSVGRLPSTTSAAGSRPALFGEFFGVPIATSAREWSIPIQFGCFEASFGARIRPPIPEFLGIFVVNLRGTRIALL